MPAGNPMLTAAGVFLGIVSYIAMYLLGQETALQRALYHSPNEGMFRSSDPTCTVCGEPIFITEGTRLTCGHVFHVNCIQKWNKVKLSCPNCRIRI